MTDKQQAAEGGKGFVPRTALGMRLATLRTRAIEAGMRLLTEDEVLEEVKRRRGGIEPFICECGERLDEDSWCIHCMNKTRRVVEKYMYRMHDAEAEAAGVRVELDYWKSLSAKMAAVQEEEHESSVSEQADIDTQRVKPRLMNGDSGISRLRGMIEDRDKEIKQKEQLIERIKKNIEWVRHNRDSEIERLKAKNKRYRERIEKLKAVIAAKDKEIKR